MVTTDTFGIMGGMEESFVLAADIGGTRARLFLGRVCEDAWHILRLHEMSCADHDGVEALIEAFLSMVEGVDAPSVACFAVAGTLEGQRMRMTNLPWEVDGERLRERFGFERVHLINDFAAQAYGLACLDDEGIVVLHPGEARAQGVRALIGPGTGLGMAVLSGALCHPLVFPSQGGLADFAPRDARELALCESLMAEHGRVSIEMLLSGHGIERLYRFVADLPPGALLARDAATIGVAALEGDPIANETLRFFARLLVSAAANLGLTTLARGGVYLTGGIVPRILPFLRAPELVERFCDHPLMSAVLARIPLYAVCDELLGLKGAARIAARLTHDEN
ncbi:MAG: glucokinase [Azoarcus sp.]|jgi:glucokinase|nr:glucokinase [Azoarcus sp.]